MAKRIQGSEDAEGIDELPDDADRALAIVRNKLDTRLSVQYSVNQVIQEATDARNLSAIFSGETELLSALCPECLS
jgi:ataxia telangiectasia mutated family protein